ncbi:MAG: sugar ABC transporter permease [Rhodospirillales bacterium 70-18]|nr:sugar ABC transporter permease [Rhodospirillales bacterium]OJY76256.1 MAG: sugar ABC transporter permease [Rhodospirillales bacterium 70-18]
MRSLTPARLLMLLPAHLLLLATIAVPSLYVLWLSFMASTYGSISGFVGLDNYRAMFADPYFWRALVNTLVVVNIVVYAELLLAVAIAHVFAQGVPMRRALIAIVLMPYAISEVVAVVIWKFMMDPDIGLIERPLAALGLPGLHWAVDPASGLALVCIISVWLNLPFSFIISYAAMRGVPVELYEAADSDGASQWQRFRHITLPSIWPALLVALIFRYIIAFRLFSEVWLLTGGGPARTTEVLAIYLYKQAFTYADFGRGAAAGWVMVLASGVFAAAYVSRLARSGFAKG